MYHARKQLAELFPHVTPQLQAETLREMNNDLRQAVLSLSVQYNRVILDEDGDLSNDQTGFKLEEIEGDLFSAGSDWSLVHCVSEDLAMGRGIAVAFKKKFGRVDELKNQRKTVEQVVYLKCLTYNVYYLISKSLYWHKPSYSNVQSCLEELLGLCRDHHISKLAMPRISSGLDALLWFEVKRVIKEVFWDTAVHIKVYRLTSINHT